MTGVVCVIDCTRLHEALQVKEQAHGITSRWSPSCSEYKEVQSFFSKQKERELAELIWAASSRRQFLLRLKSKYAGKHFMIKRSQNFS